MPASSSSTPSSSSSSPPDDELHPPLFRPLSNPQSHSDFVLHEELMAFEQQVLRFQETQDETAIHGLEDRWRALESQAASLFQRGELGQETYEVLCAVIDATETMLEAFIQTDSEYKKVVAPLSPLIASALLEATQEAEAKAKAKANKPKKTKLPSAPTTTTFLAPPPPKPKARLQIGRIPLDLGKPQPHRKRRIDSGIPGQESLKFRPCRDFFMENISDPYPTTAQKLELQNRAGINGTSLNQWFTNTRRRSGWMDIMKTHANNRKDEMKSLIDGVLSSPKYPATQAAKDAIMKMRKYVDELAREVISGDFLKDLDQCTQLNELDAARWREEERLRRREIALASRKARMAQLARDKAVARPAEKRKRDADDPSQPSKFPRTFTWSSAPSRPVASSSSAPPPPPRAVPPRSTRPAIRPSSSIIIQSKGTLAHPRRTSSQQQPRPRPPNPPPFNAGPSAGDAREEAHRPPTDLSRRRHGVPDLSAPHRTNLPLSASSTLVGSEFGETSSAFQSTSQSSSHYRSRSGSATQPSSPADYQTASDSSLVSLAAPKVASSIGPQDIPFTQGSAAPPSKPLAPNTWTLGMDRPVQSASFTSHIPAPVTAEDPAFWIDIANMPSPSISSNVAPDYSSPEHYNAPTAPNGSRSDVVVSLPYLPDGSLPAFHALTITQMQKYDPYAPPPSEISNSPRYKSFNEAAIYSEQAFAFNDPSTFPAASTASTLSFGPSLEIPAYEFGTAPGVLAFDSMGQSMTGTQPSFVQPWDTSAQAQTMYPDGAVTVQNWAIPHPGSHQL